MPTLLETVRYLRHMPSVFRHWQGLMLIDGINANASPYQQEKTCFLCGGRGNIGAKFCPLCRGFARIPAGVEEHMRRTLYGQETPELRIHAIPYGVKPDNLELHTQGDVA